MTRLVRFGSLALVALLLAATAAPAEARPLRGRGTGQFVSPNEFVNVGEGTHLGRFHEVGTAEFGATADPTVLSIEGSSVLTGANGDQLYTSFSGEFDLLTGAVSVTITYVGGSGRFADASGTAELSAQLVDDGSFHVVVEGTLDF
jgi:hypothetical protein